MIAVNVYITGFMSAPHVFFLFTWIAFDFLSVEYDIS